MCIALEHPRHNLSSSPIRRSINDRCRHSDRVEESCGKDSVRHGARRVWKAGHDRRRPVIICPVLIVVAALGTVYISWRFVSRDALKGQRAIAPLQFWAGSRGWFAKFMSAKSAISAISPLLMCRLAKFKCAISAISAISPLRDGERGGPRGHLKAGRSRDGGPG